MYRRKENYKRQKAENKKKPKDVNLIPAVFAACGILVLAVSLGLSAFFGAAGSLILGFAVYMVLILGMAEYLKRFAKSRADERKGIDGQLYTMSINAGQHILLQLLQRDAAAGQGIEKLLEQSGISFPYPYYCVTVMKIDDPGMASEEYSDQDMNLFKFSMGNIAVEMLNERMKAYHTGNSMDYITFILNMEHIPQPGELAEIFKGAIQHEADYFGISFSAGIGTVQKSIFAVSESYNNALDAVEYRLFKGKQSVTEYRNIVLQESVHMDYPYDKEQEMLRQAIRFHNRVKTMECLDDFVEQVRHIPAGDANLYIHQLGVAVNRALRQTEGLKLEHLYSMREFSHFMEILITLKEKQQQIRTSLDELFQIAAESADGKRQGIVQKVEDYIEQNYQNPDITLEDMAMAAGLSSNYIRRIFREQCGYSPVDYLARYRIETAKTLLRDTSYTAKEIARMVGYDNTKYFYSLFKKQTGQTTNEYKKSFEQ